MTSDILQAAVLACFNAITAFMVLRALKQVSFRAAMSEKSGEAGGQESYSRTAGMFGSLVMVTFFWAVANVVLHFAFTNPDRLAALISSVGSFFVYGSAMFLPYGANQIRAAFKQDGTPQAAKKDS